MAQLGEKYSLPLRTSFSNTRGFFIQMKLEGGVLPGGKLPEEFIKVSEINDLLNFKTLLNVFISVLNVTYIIYIIYVHVSQMFIIIKVLFIIKVLVASVCQWFDSKHYR